MDSRCISPDAYQERADWQVFPRLCALAEVGWSSKECRNWEDFTKRMQTHYRRLDELGVTYFIPPPECTSNAQVFVEAMEMTLVNPLGRGEVRYTLDGSDPGANSPVYHKPLRLTQTTVVKAQTILGSGRESKVAEYRFRKLRAVEAVTVARTVPGLGYEYYEGSWRSLPDFTQLTPTMTGTTSTINLDARQRDDEYALQFTGFVQIPTEGTYTFYLYSDDGSRLWIGDELVVDYDGLHAAGEQAGQVILKAGMHPITVAYFEAGGAEALEVRYEGPRMPKQILPPSQLTHKPGS